MRRAYAHEALLTIEDGGDQRAPGAAITVALCGHWDHPPPCPLAPHHTSAADEDGATRIRTLFATAPENESEVRRRIDAALARGELVGPDDATTRWRLRESTPSEVRADEAGHAAQLADQ